jgi:hypothetical protein
LLASVTVTLTVGAPLAFNSVTRPLPVSFRCCGFDIPDALKAGVSLPARRRTSLGCNQRLFRYLRLSGKPRRRSSPLLASLPARRHWIAVLLVHFQYFNQIITILWFKRPDFNRHEKSILIIYRKIKTGKSED